MTLPAGRFSNLRPCRSGCLSYMPNPKTSSSLKRQGTFAGEVTSRSAPCCEGPLSWWPMHRRDRVTFLTPSAVIIGSPGAPRHSNVHL